MRVLFVVAALLCVGVALAAPRTEEQTFSSFMDFTRRFNKQYKSVEEFTQRYTNFLATLDRIEQLNADGSNVHGITKFADLTPAEFKSMYLGFNPGLKQKLPVLQPAADAAPSSFDWRSKGAVTPVKDQQQCGSCWAFSTVEEIESMNFLAGNGLMSLSPQQIVSCDTVDAGCDGGDTITAYQYVIQAGGIELDSSYPYTSGNGDSGTCEVNSSKFVAKINGSYYATPSCDDSCDNQNEDLLATNLASTGPVSICVDAEPWQTYSGGILTASSGCSHDYSDLDHCVQLVGYNNGGSQPYWIVRNSWNTDWGIDGYIYVAKGQNVCGIADEATICTIPQ